MCVQVHKIRKVNDEQYPKDYVLVKEKMLEVLTQNSFIQGRTADGVTRMNTQLNSRDAIGSCRLIKISPNWIASICLNAKLEVRMACMDSRKGTWPYDDIIVQINVIQETNCR